MSLGVKINMSIQSGKVRLVSMLLVMLFLQLLGCTSKDDENNNNNTNQIVSTDATGTWNGVVIDSYYCESGAETIQMVVNENDLTVTVGSNGAVWSSTVMEPSANGYTVKYTVKDMSANATDTAERSGQIDIDANFKYAVVVMQSKYGGNTGFIGVLEKSPATNISYQDSDLVGSWSGYSFQIDAGFNLQSSDTSDLTVASSATGLTVSGTDGSQMISGDAPAITNNGSTSAVFTSGDGGNPMLSWGGMAKNAIFVLSSDKKALAAGFIDGLCNYSLFDTLDQQKFFVWTKQ